MAKNERKLTHDDKRQKVRLYYADGEIDLSVSLPFHFLTDERKLFLTFLLGGGEFAVLSGAVVLSRVSFLSMVESMSPLEFLFFLLVMLLLTAVHEGIHGLTWGLFAESHWRSIRFGVIWKALTPYCTCAQPMKRGQYILGAAMPTLVLGIGLTAAAALTGIFWVFILALAMIFGGGGDFTIILKILLHRQCGKEAVYYDHPYECGVVVFEKD